MMPEGKPDKKNVGGTHEPVSFEYDLASILTKTPPRSFQTPAWQFKKAEENKPPSRAVAQLPPAPEPVQAKESPRETAKTEAVPTPTSPLSRPTRIQAAGFVGLALVIILGLGLFLREGGTNGVAARPESTAAAAPTAAANTDAKPETPAAPNSARSTAQVQIVIFPSSGATVMVDGQDPRPVPPFIELAPGSHRLYFTAAGYTPELIPAEVKAGERRNVSVFLKAISSSSRKATPEVPAHAAVLPPKPATSPKPADRSTAVAAPSPAATEPGTLAINAPIPVEIFEGTQNLGTTPATLELSPGLHTLEYRYGNLKKSVTHTIHSNESITTTVTFDVMLQINARPWAQVLIDGVQPRPLGQTPLSDVKVSAGTVLIFRHPSFPEKKVRVTGENTTIQVVFQ